MISKINLRDKIREIDGRPWFPVEIARVNDQVVRMALVKGEYHWHKHANEGELFYVLSGEMTIQIKEGKDMTLKEGEIAVVPKGVEHCPKSSQDTYILMFEPYELKSRGD